jgi:hypothetical protein
LRGRGICGRSSPTAQVKAEKLLEAALLADGLSQQELEADDLGNGLLAETKDQAHGSLLAQIELQTRDPALKQALDQAVGEVESEEDEHLERARDTLAGLALQMVLEGPPPAPDRKLQAVSGPLPPIEEIHPSPVTAGLLKPAQLPPWQESLTVRTMKAKP